MKSLVVGNHTQGLGVVRGLGREGIPVHVLYDKHICLSRFSKYTSAFHLAEKGCLGSLYRAESREKLLNTMLGLVPEGEQWVLFGVSEDIIHFFYTHEDVLREKFLFPENNIMDIIDKHTFARVSEKAGVPSPATYLLSEMSPQKIGGKAFVAKGRLGNKFRAISNIKGKILTGKEDLERIKSYIAGTLDEDEVIIQEVVDSKDNIKSCCGFSINGKIHAGFMYEKLRQGPDRFGTGTFNKSIFDIELLRSGKRIIKETNYTGIFEIEFLRDDHDGKYHTIEMNPRTWKCIDLAISCGQNLCKNYYQYLNDRIVPEQCMTYQTDKYWAHFVADAYYMMRKMQTRFNYKKGMTFCDLSKEDIKPFLAEVFLLPLLALKI